MRLISWWVKRKKADVGMLPANKTSVYGFGWLGKIVAGSLRNHDNLWTPQTREQRTKDLVGFKSSSFFLFRLVD